MHEINSRILIVDATAPRSVSGATLLSTRVLSAVVAMMLGAAVLFIAGFSSNDFAHASAHDVRHAAGFPCH